MQRENTISEHLRDLLDVYPEVKIPGIGVFSIINKPAWIDIDNKELYPPTKTLSISTEPSEGVNFIKGVQDLIGGSNPKVQEVQSALSAHIIELEHQGSIHIAGVGVLTQDPSGQLSLVDVHPSWGEGTSYLPVLPLSPITLLTKDVGPLIEKKITDTSKSNSLSTTASSNDVWKQSVLPLIVLGLGVCFLLWYLNRNTTDKKESVKSEITIDTLSNDLSNQNAEDFINAKYKNLLTAEILVEGCKIVVGSYKQKENAQTQSSRISELGYNVQLSSTDGGYRVLIVFDCKTYNLKSYLDKIKSDLASNAWYLSPQINAEDL